MSASPIVFGEVLFDTFPDGQRVLGGAPFNVAWHLQGFGHAPRFISRVGDDDAGREILERADAWGLSTAGIQVDRERPTGRVRVQIQDDEPSFEIEPDQAYDFIEAPPGDPDGVLLYHGTLALRSTVSRRTLENLGLPALGVFCDLNLREPWWKRETIDWCLGRAAWIKLSDTELQTLAGVPADSRDDCRKAAAQLAGRYRIPNLVATRGSDGVLGLFAGGEAIWKNASEPSPMVDTVGAGDAFAAVMIVGILEGWNHGSALERAAQFAADICGQQGATAPDPSLYRGRFRGPFK